MAWLEGVRVHPGFRRAKIATALLDRMLQWAAKKGVTVASAIVSRENLASQRMLERSGFSVTSVWAYYGTEKRSQEHATDARIATKQDLAESWEYLRKSHTYRLCARRYVSSWQWYPLDRKTLQDLISAGRVVVTGRTVDGLAILNRTGYWDRPDILQIVYLDGKSTKSLKDLLTFAENLHAQGHSSFHVLCHNSRKMASEVEKLGMQESEVFLLYDKKVFTG